MQINNGHADTFDTAAAAYDRWRPTYADALYADLFTASPIGPGSRVLEIGIGTGQATRPVLETGCSLTAVEPGRNLAAFSEEKFCFFQNFQTVTTTFEDFPGENGSFDLIYAATAFHWVKEEIGYEKVFRLLKSGGVFARFANRPCPDPAQSQLNDAIQALYAEYMPGRSKAPPSPFTAAQAESIAAIAGRYGFTDLSCRLYRRKRTFTGEEYTQLLGTYSDHLALKESLRREFFARIREAIELSGNRLVLLDTMDLELARKP